MLKVVEVDVGLLRLPGGECCDRGRLRRGQPVAVECFFDAAPSGGELADEFRIEPDDGRGAVVDVTPDEADSFGEFGP